MNSFRKKIGKWPYRVFSDRIFWENGTICRRGPVSYPPPSPRRRGQRRRAPAGGAAHFDVNPIRGRGVLGITRAAGLLFSLPNNTDDPGALIYQGGTQIGAELPAADALDGFFRAWSRGVPHISGKKSCGRRGRSGERPSAQIHGGYSGEQEVGRRRNEGGEEEEWAYSSSSSSSSSFSDQHLLSGTKLRHRYRPLAMSTKVQKPDRIADRICENRS